MEADGTVEHWVYGEAHSVPDAETVEPEVEVTATYEVGKSILIKDESQDSKMARLQEQERNNILISN